MKQPISHASQTNSCKKMLRKHWQNFLAKTTILLISLIPSEQQLVRSLLKMINLQTQQWMWSRRRLETQIHLVNLKTIRRPSQTWLIVKKILPKSLIPNLKDICLTGSGMLKAALFRFMSRSCLRIRQHLQNRKAINCAVFLTKNSQNKGSNSPKKMPIDFWPQSR